MISGFTSFQEAAFLSGGIASGGEVVFRPEKGEPFRPKHG
jgi:hypothetical protein